MCPDGLVASGDGGCIPASDCPCVHNEASYQPGQTIRMGCNTWYQGGGAPAVGGGAASPAAGAGSWGLEQGAVG